MRIRAEGEDKDEYTKFNANIEQGTRHRPLYKIHATTAKKGKMVFIKATAGQANIMDVGHGSQYRYGMAASVGTEEYPANNHAEKG